MISLERFVDWKTSFGGGVVGSMLAAPGAQSALAGGTTLFDWLSLGVGAFGVLVAAGSLGFKVYSWMEERKGGSAPSSKPRPVPQESGGGNQPPKGGGGGNNP